MSSPEVDPLAGGVDGARGTGSSESAVGERVGHGNNWWKVQKWNGYEAQREALIILGRPEGYMPVGRGGSRLG